jgi:Alr-MurF fusion protein
LFFALPGPRRDGHLFIHDAYKKGVRSFVVLEQLSPPASDCNFIVVDDVLESLQLLCAYHRSRFRIPVIGITGSNGKTIVKEWLNDLLSVDHVIVRSPKSFNSQTGVPLSVWQLAEGDQLGIFEAGISMPGEMEKLERVIQPTIGVFTNIGEAHSSGFDSIEQKISEKLKLFTNVERLVYCSDHEAIGRQVYQKLRDAAGGPRMFTWGQDTAADMQVLSVVREADHTTIEYLYGETKQSLSIPFTDGASVENALHCVAVLLMLDVPASQIASRLARLHNVAMRLELREGIGNCSIINDAYSADVSSFKIALDFLAQQNQHPRKTVIVSDFAGSSTEPESLYSEIAESMRQVGVTQVIAIGPVISQYQALFEWSPERHFFPTAEDFLAHFPLSNFREETILIKGARKFELEKIVSRLQSQTHQTTLEIDLNAVTHNLKQFQELLLPSTKTMAMVKAFSYGTGSFEVANVLQFSKVDYLAVAYPDEGVELRKAGITLPIMVMNSDPDAFRSIVDNDLEPEIFSLKQFDSFRSFVQSEGLNNYPVHLEIETGMNRLGLNESELNSILQPLSDGRLKIQSVFSHLVASENPEYDDFTEEQARRFESMTSLLASAVGYPFLRHLLNTSGVARFPQYQYDMVRIGIGLYGLGGEGLNLIESVSLKSSVAQLKSLQPGESVSYGRSGRVLRESRIATVRIGYADGYPRSLGNGNGLMLVNGKPAPTIGHVCMDMTMIDVTDIADVEEGMEVIVFGKNSSVQHVARAAGTIPYEILSSISQRVKRVYFQE